ncbi:FtsX-like permease family protein [Panacibacter ginsenosidivorans]|uniref:FtsX-like permease family protein n=1 Tax=Panacibacter ginsenosidivorans TaxID=1813871 RepID=A0A5B8V385_9BACT|nr:ABC transporter permease [Panacibacter ginsenosidivorans]QEC65977.1 FtsX-like permease family protein [Panacibacter ginsenosidivorans]
MIRNYLKIAWRNLFRNKGFSITNILGLTIGITCTMLILLWVYDELTYDKFQKNYDNIYQVIANRDFNNQVFTDRSMVLPLASELEHSSPQIKHAVVTTYQQQRVLAHGEDKIKKEGYIVSDHFFDMFSWKFIKGSAATALKDPNSIVLSESAAKAFFGNEDPINKVIRFDNSQDVKVTAVVEDAPGNSTFRFDWITPFNYNDPDTKNAMGEWVNSSWNVFVQTVPNVDTSLLNKTITKVKRAHGKDEISTYFAFPMSHWHLYSDFDNGVNTGGMIEYVHLFSVIAIIILLIACINFMNLSTARSEKRAKEVGIRKTLGSNKKRLILQFFFESMILTLIAFVIAIIAVLLLLPSFNQLVDKHLSLNATQPLFWLSATVIILFTGLVAGSYPALYLSSFNPVKVLKGTLSSGKKTVMPRHILVVSQFVISILLISATIIVYQQIQHVKDRDMGYNPNNLVMIPSTPDTDKSYDVIKQELLSTGLISNVTRTSSPITEVWWNTGAPDYDGKPANSQIIMGGLAVDVDFTKTMGIKMLQGRDFSGTPADSTSMILNKAAVDAMKLKNPVGMQMRYGRNYTVIGVSDNVIMTSPFEPAYPMLMVYDGNGSSMNTLRLKDGVAPQKAMASIETIFKKYNPTVPFEYQFVDQEFQKKFLTEDLIGKLTNIFSGLAIFICCLGLAGLASFTIEKRIREIGVRKVLGASVQQLLLLISKEFLKLVTIAFVIAVPLTYWAMTNWLSKYDYRISISIWLFVLVGIAMFLLTLVVVCMNTIRVAMSNPVKSLRTE